MSVVVSMLGWLIGSPLGRRIALLGTTAAIVALVLWRSRRAGYRDRVAEEAIEALQAAETRIRTDEDLRRLDARGRADALRRWVRELTRD